MKSTTTTTTTTAMLLLLLLLAVGFVLGYVVIAWLTPDQPAVYYHAVCTPGTYYVGRQVYGWECR